MGKYDRFKVPGTFVFSHNDSDVEVTLEVTDWSPVDTAATGWTQFFWGPKDLDDPGKELIRRAWYLKETACQVMREAMAGSMRPGDLSDAEGWCCKLDGSPTVGIKFIKCDTWPGIEHSDVSLLLADKLGTEEIDPEYDESEPLEEGGPSNG